MYLHREQLKGSDLFKSLFRKLLLLALLFNLFTPVLSQINDMDKCGYDTSKAQLLKQVLGMDWGYGYDSLLADIQTWGQSSYITIDSLGASVQDRAIWQLTITSDSQSIEQKHIVFMHARTHPNEVQGWWVANEFINLLLADDPFSNFMREKCTFYIIPMYNPDGVELGHPRENANGIDIESNWDADSVEPEVEVLRNRFTELMDSETPIKIALNMHASFRCKRYFVYHASTGTSPEYTILEQDFIYGIQSYFITGIESWDYFISWTSGTPTYYPESWFWMNHGESVMALTYEDGNCEEAGQYDSTAYALLHGIGDYLGLSPPAEIVDNLVPNEYILMRNFPNPFNSMTTIQYHLPRDSQVNLSIYHLFGGKIRTLVSKSQKKGSYKVLWDGRNGMDIPVASGIYFNQITAGEEVITNKMILLK